MRTYRELCMHLGGLGGHQYEGEAKSVLGPGARVLIGRWSLRWLWRYRVAEWDQDQETIKAVALNSSIVEMAERQAAQATQATQAVAGLMLPHMALAKAIRRLSAPRVVLAPAAR